MTGNPKDSPWRSTPRSKRKRPGRNLTLSDAVWDAIGEMAGAGGRSDFVEKLVRKEAKERGIEIPEEKDGSK